MKNIIKFVSIIFFLTGCSENKPILPSKIYAGLNMVSESPNSKGWFASKYRNGRYVQTNGKIGNFNSKPFKRLSRRAKMYKRFVQDVDKIGKVGNVVEGFVIAYDIVDDGNLKTSNAINGTLTLVAIVFPASAPFIGVYFAADFIFNFDETIDNHSNGIQFFENGLQIFENEK